MAKPILVLKVKDIKTFTEYLKDNDKFAELKNQYFTIIFQCEYGEKESAQLLVKGRHHKTTKNLYKLLNGKA